MPLAARLGAEDLPHNAFQRVVQAAEHGVTPYIVLSILCFVLFGIGLATIPPTDRDESRFMQATKQMIESGDYIHIRVQDEPRTKKPVGIYWLQAAAVRAMSQPLNRAWPYRLPSALGAWLAVLMTCACGRRLFGERAGLVAGLMMTSLPLTIAEAHLAKTDAVLLGLTTVAMTMLGQLYVAQADDPRAPTRIWHVVAFWLAVGAAVLIKGPVVLLVTGATVVTLALSDHNGAAVRMIKPAWGIPIAVLVVTPWIALLALGGEQGFVADAVRQDVLPKLIGGQEGHGAAPGTYLIVTALTAWPWSLLIPVALMAAWPTRTTPAVRFCLAWLVPSWLVFEAVPTKLPHYILPLLPAAALLLGAVVQDGRRWRGVVTRPTGLGWRAIFGLISLGLGAAVVWGVRTYGYTPTAATAVAAVAAALGAGICLAAGRLTPTVATAFTATIAAVFCTAMVGGVLPRLDNLWISARLATEVIRHAPKAPVVLVGFHEPSAVFLLGTDTLLTAANAAADVLLTRPGTLAVVDAPDVPAVTQAVEDGGKQIMQVGKIDGYNYARGHWVALVLLTAQ